MRVSDKSVSLKVRDIPVSLCRPNPNQPRKVFDEASLAELAESIKRHGLLQPITVRRDERGSWRFVVAGERRYQAKVLLGCDTIAAVVTEGDGDEIALIENLQREDLSAVEEAQALAKLKEKHGYSLNKLGEVVGKAKSTVANILKINDLPEKIKREASLSASNRSLIMEIARVRGEHAQLELWPKALRDGLSVKDVRKARSSKLPQATGESEAEKVLGLGKRFLGGAERLAESDTPLNDGEYEELLDMYQSFLGLLKRLASTT